MLEAPKELAQKLRGNSWPRGFTLLHNDPSISALNRTPWRDWKRRSTAWPGQPLELIERLRERPRRDREPRHPSGFRVPGRRQDRQSPRSNPELEREDLRQAPAPARQERPRRGFGSAKGEIEMAEDFDEPLEDFREYM